MFILCSDVIRPRGRRSQLRGWERRRLSPDPRAAGARVRPSLPAPDGSGQAALGLSRGGSASPGPGKAPPSVRPPAPGWPAPGWARGSRGPHPEAMSQHHPRVGRGRGHMVPTLPVDAASGRAEGRAHCPKMPAGAGGGQTAARGAWTWLWKEEPGRRASPGWVRGLLGSQLQGFHFQGSGNEASVPLCSRSRPSPSLCGTRMQPAGSAPRLPSSNPDAPASES